MRAALAVLAVVAVALHAAASAPPRLVIVEEPPGGVAVAGGYGGVAAIIESGVLRVVAPKPGGALFEARVAEGVVAASTWGSWVVYATQRGVLGIALVDPDRGAVEVKAEYPLPGSLEWVQAGPWGLACALTRTPTGYAAFYAAPGGLTRLYPAPPSWRCPTLEPRAGLPPGEPAPLGLGWRVLLDRGGAIVLQPPGGGPVAVFEAPESWEPVALSTAPLNGLDSGVAALYHTPLGYAVVAAFIRLGEGGAESRVVGAYSLPIGLNVTGLGPAMADPPAGRVYVVLQGASPAVVEVSSVGMRLRGLPSDARVVAYNSAAAIAATGDGGYTVLGSLSYWLHLLGLTRSEAPFAPAAVLRAPNGTVVAVYESTASLGARLAAVTPAGVVEAVLNPIPGRPVATALLPGDYTSVYASREGSLYAPIPAPQPPPLTPRGGVLPHPDPPGLPCRPTHAIDLATGAAEPWPPSSDWLAAAKGPLGLVCGYNAAPTGVVAPSTPTPREPRPQGGYEALVTVIHDPPGAPPGAYGLAVATAAGNAQPPPGAAIVLTGPTGVAATLNAPPPGAASLAVLQAPCPPSACTATLSLPPGSPKPPLAVVTVNHTTASHPTLGAIPYPGAVGPHQTTPPPTPPQQGAGQQPRQATPAEHAAIAAYTAFIAALACRIAAATANRKQ